MNAMSLGGAGMSRFRWFPLVLLTDAIQNDPQWLTSVLQIGNDGFLLCYKRRPVDRIGVLK
jgi:hypothetical protein